jgi:hypothetical protein
MRVGQSRRRDFNEAAIVSELESIGVIVVRISAQALRICSVIRAGTGCRWK